MGKFNKKKGNANNVRSQFQNTKNKNGFIKGNKQKNGQWSKKGKYTEKNNTTNHGHKNTAQIQNKNKKNKNNIASGNSNLGEYKDLVGKSLFQLIPEGVGEDQFAALGGDDQNLDQEYDRMEDEVQEQYENDEQEYEDNEEGQEEQDDYEVQEYQEEGDDNEQQEDEQFEEEDGDQFIEEQENEGEQYQEQQDQEDQKYQQQQSDLNVDISVINLKIQQTLSVLMSVEKLGQGKPRKYYIQKLKKYIHRYYGYNYELIDHFLSFFNPTQMVQFFEANQSQRPLSIRTNTLKTRRKELAQALIQRGVNLDPLAQWSSVGIKIYETKVPIGATPEYLAGHYMLQSASSLLPVIALDPQMHEKILDMAAAPGGKTSYIAQLMKNTGSLFANDLKKDRLRALQFNLYRLGISNTVVTCKDGRKYSNIFPNTFDRVLLDAPCTGLGIIAKDHSIKANRVLIDIYKNSHIQKQLILAAIDCLKIGGVLVYSTCSVSPLENQQVVNYALKKRFIKIVDMEDLIDVGEAGLTKFIDKRYHVDLRKTKRIYPHILNMDGFYYAKIVKIANGSKISQTKQEDSIEQQGNEEYNQNVEDQVEDNIEEMQPVQPKKMKKMKKTKKN